MSTLTAQNQSAVGIAGSGLTRQNLAHLSFAPTREFRRALVIELQADRVFRIHLYAQMKMKYPCSPMLAWATGPIEKSRLAYDHDGPPCFWCESAAFDLTLSEAQQIEEKLAPLGLKLVRKEIVS